MYTCARLFHSAFISKAWQVTAKHTECNDWPMGFLHLFPTVSPLFSRVAFEVPLLPLLLFFFGPYDRTEGTQTVSTLSASKVQTWRYWYTATSCGPLLVGSWCIVFEGMGLTSSWQCVHSHSKLTRPAGTTVTRLLLLKSSMPAYTQNRLWAFGTHKWTVACMTHAMSRNRSLYKT